MAQVVNLALNSSPTATGLITETYTCDTLTDLAIVITPINIKRIANVIATPLNLTAAANLATTVYSFTETSTQTTLTIGTGVNNCQFRVTILGAA